VQIEVASASKSFGSLLVFSDFSCRVEDRRVTALVGPSGSGKSTLLAAMAGFQQLDSGVIIFRQDDQATPPLPDRVAWIPQGANALGARTALDNVMVSALAAGLGIEEARRMGEYQLDRVGLAGSRSTLARHLSGGELQRVGFARALAAQKPIIFADEPTSSLDEANTELIADLLHSLQDTALILVATHDPVLVAAAQDGINVRRSA